MRSCGLIVSHEIHAGNLRSQPSTRAESHTRSIISSSRSCFGPLPPISLHPKHFDSVHDATGKQLKTIQLSRNQHDTLWGVIFQLWVVPLKSPFLPCRPSNHRTCGCLRQIAGTAPTSKSTPWQSWGILLGAKTVETSHQKIPILPQPATPFWSLKIHESLNTFFSKIGCWHVFFVRKKLQVWETKKNLPSHLISKWDLTPSTPGGKPSLPIGQATHHHHCNPRLLWTLSWIRLKTPCQRVACCLPS